MKRSVLIVGILCFAGGLAWADDNRPSESEMFGGSAATTATASPTPSAALAGDTMAGKPHNLLASAEENTQIGGTLSTEADYYLQQGVALDRNFISNPNILFLYLDSKLENDNRVFARIRTFYDPTGISNDNPTTISYSNPYGFGQQNSDYLSVQLQELRISVNLNHAVFLTIGRQKVKYGAAKFFNPTDFLNSQLFNFFLPSDERTGVDMVQAQIPSGTANLYLTGLPGNPTNGNPSGGYFRGEWGYDSLAFLESGEISLSGYLPKGQPGRAGFDISQGIGDLDAYFEGAVEQDTAGNWQGAFSTGAGWDVRYADEQSQVLTLGAEYADLPFPTVSQGSNIVSYSSIQFGVFSLNLASPFKWTDITLAETNLYDFTAQSGFSRLDAICQFTNRIDGRVYVSAPWGNTGGVFSSSNLLGQAGALLGQTGARMDVSF